MISGRNLSWEVRVGPDTFTPAAPGGLKGEISLEYNSVWACISGSLTFDGYKDWAPYSRLVQVFVNGSRIWLGVIGLPSSTRSPTGQRTTEVPLLGLHVLDQEGLAALGLGTAFPEVGVGGGMTFLGVGSPLDQVPSEVTTQDVEGSTVTQTVMVDPPFGETVQAGLERVFKGNPLASWGVQPSGTRVAGVPWGGTNFSSDAPNIRVQPANYELTGYVSEFVERPGERWAAQSHARSVPPYLPRRGASVQSDNLLGDHTAAAPVTVQAVHFDDAPATSGTLVGVVNLRALVAASLANPNAHGVTESPTALVVDVQVTFDHPAQPDVPAEAWAGQNVVPLGTWQDAAAWEYLTLIQQRAAQGSEPQGAGELIQLIDAPYFPSSLLTSSQAADKTVTIKDKGYWRQAAGYFGNSGLTPDQQADLDRLKQAFRDTFSEYLKLNLYGAQLQEWNFYLSQLQVTVEWGEWLTTSGAAQAAAAAHESAPALNPVQPTPPPPTPVFPRWAWDFDPKNRRAENAHSALDPSLDPGLLKPLYKNVASLNTGERRELIWRFAVPTELLQQLDPTLGEDYRWAFGVTFHGVRLGLKARGKITSTAYYAKRVLGTTNTARDLPAYEMNAISTPTLQGVMVGQIPNGPFTLDGHQVTNARVVIAKEGFRTEFQTGAPNGGRR